jgi:hypothetical protein
MMRRLAILLCVLATTAIPSALAQTTSGTILGVVVDAQGGVLPGAAVTVRRLSNSFGRILRTLNRQQGEVAVRFAF